jgi:integrase
VAKVENHAALPYRELGAFMATLRQQPGSAAALLEFIILTAVRTSEAIGAQWDEIDVRAKTWVIPPERMKSAREHRVPLSDRALAVLKRMRDFDAGSPYVFPGGKEGKPLSNMAALVLLKRMKRTDITTHGFRSTFRDWAAEQTNYPREVAEMALAHVIESKVEAAYRRGDLFEKRAKLMRAWADYCAREPLQQR